MKKFLNYKISRLEDLKLSNFTKSSLYTLSAIFGTILFVIFNSFNDIFTNPIIYGFEKIGERDSLFLSLDMIIFFITSGLIVFVGLPVLLGYVFTDIFLLPILDKQVKKKDVAVTIYQRITRRSYNFLTAFIAFKILSPLLFERLSSSTQIFNSTFILFHVLILSIVFSLDQAYMTIINKLSGRYRD